MGSDPRKRQKKLERRSAKRKEKKHQTARRESAGLADRMAAAAGAPVLDCWVSAAIDEEGLGQVLLSRELPNGSVAVACFLVDRYCLGVKDAFAELLPRSDYNSKYRTGPAKELPTRDVEPAEARKLIEGAVAYARGLGLSPHPDYARALPLFGAVRAEDSDAQYEFGKDGQPLFIPGSLDSPARCRQVLAILEDTCGPGKYHFALPMGSPDLGDDADFLAGPDAPLLDLDEDEDDEDEV
jgi:hypothetical protein